MFPCTSAEAQHQTKSCRRKGEPQGEHKPQGPTHSNERLQLGRQETGLCTQTEATRWQWTLRACAKAEAQGQITNIPFNVSPWSGSHPGLPKPLCSQIGIRDTVSMRNPCAGDTRRVGEKAGLGGGVGWGRYKMHVRSPFSFPSQSELHF